MKHKLRLTLVVATLVACSTCTLSIPIFSAVYKRSTLPVFKAHGMAQASISDCVTETFSAIRTEPVVFSVSVGENIAYGLPDEDVSKAANAHDFIISLPQSIAISRALLKNALILILDEATSALDAMNECLVQEALNHLMKGRTTLVIAHRLSTVQNAYQIAVCSKGRIAELDTHFELLTKKGQYASLVGTQRLAFE